MVQSIYNILNGPSLTHPNGGESFFSKEIEVRWIEPSNISITTDLIWYEILLSDSYDKENESFVQLSTVPSQVTSYNCILPDQIKSDKCRIGIRAVNQKGERSKISFSANDFSIKSKRLPTPVVTEPINKGE